MEMIEDIVREMRGIKDYKGDAVPVFVDWADRIEQADASHCDGCRLLVDDLKQVNGLKAEAERLRSALKAIRDGETMFDYFDPRNIAELALNESMVE